MSGGAVAYQLRVNKCVDRNLFIELLQKISGYKKNISEYGYYGFAGYSFEDFRQLHIRLNISKMTSIESDRQVYKRQVYNNPYRCIELLNTSSKDFIDQNGQMLESPCIVWLDYSEANRRGEQIDEFTNLISHLNPGDVARITLNANISSLYTKEPGDTQREVSKKRMEKYKDQMSDQTLPNISETMFLKNSDFARVLYYAIYVSTIKNRRNSSTQFIPLMALTYRDAQHQMMTLTGIILENDENENDFYSYACIDDKWNLYIGDYLNWQTVKIHDINIPELTLKEKLLIDSLLPLSEPNSNGQLLCCIENNYKLTLNKTEVENYLKYYRQYPGFRQVIL